MAVYCILSWCVRTFQPIHLCSTSQQWRWIAFTLLTSLLGITALHGTSIIKILVIVSINYLIGNHSRIFNNQAAAQKARNGIPCLHGHFAFLFCFSTICTAATSLPCFRGIFHSWCERILIESSFTVTTIRRTHIRVCDRSGMSISTSLHCEWSVSTWTVFSRKRTSFPD